MYKRDPNAISTVDSLPDYERKILYRLNLVLILMSSGFLCDWVPKAWLWLTSWL